MTTADYRLTIWEETARSEPAVFTVQIIHNDVVLKAVMTMVVLHSLLMVLMAEWLRIARLELVILTHDLLMQTAATATWHQCTILLHTRHWDVDQIWDVFDLDAW